MGIEVLAGAALFASAASAGVQYFEGKRIEEASEDQANERRRQLEQEKRIADIKNMREQRDMVRRARVIRAATLNTAANTGTMDSSGALGAVSSIGSQVGSNLGYFNQAQEIGGNIFASQVREGDAIRRIGQSQARMTRIGAVGNLSSTIFAGAGGFQTLFKG